MNTTSLVAEFLLIGIIPFFAVIFFLLTSFRIQGLSFLSQFTDYSTVLIFVSTLIIYILGAITHRLTDFVNTESFPFLKRVPYFEKFWSEHSARQFTEVFVHYFEIYQFGSESLVNKLEYYESQVRIFKSILLTTPILAFALLFWSWEQFGVRVAIISFMLCIILTIAAVIAFWRQRRNYRLSVQWMSEIILKQHKEILGND